MSATLLGVARAVTLVALIAAFTYGFAVRVRWAGVVAAVLASLAYGAAYAPALLSQYRFGHPALLAALALGGIVALAVLVWAFLRWPIAVTPTLALLAAVRIPIPVSRGTSLGAAPEYLFLLVPLYGTVVAALVAEAMDPDEPGPQLFERDPLRLPFAALIGWAALSMLWTAGPVTGAIRLFSFWLFLPAAYHAMWRGMRHVDATRTIASERLGATDSRPVWLPTVVSLVVLGGVLGLIGVDQHVRQWLFFKNTNLEATQWQQVIFRVNAVFWDPNMFARFLILTGLLAGVVWFAARGRLKWLGLAIIPMALAFVFTYSRSAWVVAVFAAVVVVWLTVGWKRALVALLVLVLVVGAAFLVIRAPTFRKTTMQVLEATLGVAEGGRFEPATPINKITGGRYGLMKGGVAMYTARPIAGWGLGSFPMVYTSYRPPNAPPKLRESHNSVITIAAELGTVGLVLFGWGFVAIAREIRRALARAREPEMRARGERALAVAVTAGLLTIFLHSMFYAALVEDPFAWVFLALLSAVALAPGQGASPEMTH